MKNRIGLLLLLVMLCFTSQAQFDSVRVSKKQALVMPDSVFIPKEDTIIIVPKGVDYEIFNSKRLLSQYFYDSVYAAAQRRKITKELYNLLIINRPTSNKEIKQDPKKSEDYFKAYSGKTISKIKFTSVDIFSGSVNDTTITSQSRIIKFCNKIHHNTRISVVKKHLLFKEGRNVDPFEMADTERIIRSLSFIEDAKIVLKIDPNDVDKVQVIVITKDRFPWTVDFDIDNNEGAIFNFTNKNILGTGNELGTGYWYSFEDNPTHGFDAELNIRNIRNSFVDGKAFLTDNFKGKSKGVTLRRRFISPKIKYFGAATLEHVQPNQNLVFSDSIYQENPNIDRKSYDVWIARSFQVSARKNISIAARLNHDKFSARPMTKADSNINFHNHHLLLGALSYSRINFLKTKKIQSFNITEDVPVGFIYSVFFGKDWTEFGVRDYRGFRTSYSMYSNKIGYALFNLESGYFVYPNQRINQVFQIDFRHFTPLISLGGSDSRIFSRLSFFEGDRLTIPLSQSLEGENRLRNIDGDQLSGNRLVTFTSELVTFLPWYYYGFKFATLANFGVGRVWEDRIETPYSQTFYRLGGGIRIQNESLVINTFEFRFSYFPSPAPNGDRFSLKLTLAAPSFFQNLSITKPRIFGLE